MSKGVCTCFTVWSSPFIVTHTSLDLCRYLRHSHCFNHHCKELYMHTKHILIIPSLVPMISVPRPSLFFAALLLSCVILKANWKTKHGEACEWCQVDVKWTLWGGVHIQITNLDFIIEHSVTRCSHDCEYSIWPVRNSLSWGICSWAPLPLFAALNWKQKMGEAWECSTVSWVSNA